MQETQNRISQYDLSSLPTRIRVVGYTYLVDFGPTTQPRFHTVNKQRQCFCKLGVACPAAEATCLVLPWHGDLGVRGHSTLLTICSIKIDTVDN